MKVLTDPFKRKEKVEEDLYFAKRDTELLAALRSQRVRPALGSDLLIVSGGQTGVDRAALEAALACDLPIGGWCPKGRRAEDGRIPDRFTLLETPNADYSERTFWNLRDSDATLILHRGPLSRGTLLTAQIARRGARPLLLRDLTKGFDAESAVDWLRVNHVGVLNCAGPRESGAPGIYDEALDAFKRLFDAWKARKAAKAPV